MPTPYGGAEGQKSLTKEDKLRRPCLREPMVIQSQSYHMKVVSIKLKLLWVQRGKNRVQKWEEYQKSLQQDRHKSDHVILPKEYFSGFYYPLEKMELSDRIYEN